MLCYSHCTSCHIIFRHIRSNYTLHPHSKRWDATGKLQSGSSSCPCMTVTPLVSLFKLQCSYSVAIMQTQTSVQISNSNPCQIPLVKKLQILIFKWYHLNLYYWKSDQEIILGNFLRFFSKDLDPFKIQTIFKLDFSLEIYN
jgi:hypothetical protein